ncbi:hypothetical protein EVAR_46624_1 [Eumeta japonica]|uniref:Uncharacterized protein n=1 Tax=Eumeta variegata TaxID=151549 RepID=A0A4C1WHK3_EUMVA|nr:hypothetical protein EVAR_46624_1 [Eumeta japonica]
MKKKGKPTPKGIATVTLLLPFLFTFTSFLPKQAVHVGLGKWLMDDEKAAAAYEAFKADPKCEWAVFQWFHRIQRCIDLNSDVKVAEGIIALVSDLPHVFHSFLNKKGKLRQVIA